MGLDLGQRVLAAAEADFQPQLRRGWRRGGIGEGQARQRRVQQKLLARAQPVATRAPIQPVRRWLDAQRPNADFRPGTRSVFSQVKLSFTWSGSRPKWP